MTKTHKKTMTMVVKIFDVNASTIRSVSNKKEKICHSAEQLDAQAQLLIVTCTATI